MESVVQEARTLGYQALPLLASTTNRANRLHTTMAASYQSRFGMRLEELGGVFLINYRVDNLDENCANRCPGPRTDVRETKL